MVDDSSRNIDLIVATLMPLDRISVATNGRDALLLAGKVGIPDRILLKPGKLSEEEFEDMKQHTCYGRKIIEDSEKNLGADSFLGIAGQIAYSHHEHWDGTGYPEGLKGRDIPLAGRLMALADVYDALRTKRVYKPAPWLSGIPGPTVLIVRRACGSLADIRRHLSFDTEYG